MGNKSWRIIAEVIFITNSLRIATDTSAALKRDRRQAAMRGGFSFRIRMGKGL